MSALRTAKYLRRLALVRDPKQRCSSATCCADQPQQKATGKEYSLVIHSLFQTPRVLQQVQQHHKAHEGEAHLVA